MSFWIFLLFFGAWNALAVWAAVGTYDDLKAIKRILRR